MLAEETHRLHRSHSDCRLQRRPVPALPRPLPTMAQPTKRMSDEPSPSPPAKRRATVASIDSDIAQPDAAANAAEQLRERSPEDLVELIRQLQSAHALQLAALSARQEAVQQELADFKRSISALFSAQASTLQAAAAGVGVTSPPPPPPFCFPSSRTAFLLVGFGGGVPFPATAPHQLGRSPPRPPPSPPPFLYPWSDLTFLLVACGGSVSCQATSPDLLRRSTRRPPRSPSTSLPQGLLGHGLPRSPLRNGPRRPLLRPRRGPPRSCSRPSRRLVSSRSRRHSGRSRPLSLRPVRTAQRPRRRFGRGLAPCPRTPSRRLP